MERDVEQDASRPQSSDNGPRFESIQPTASRGAGLERPSSRASSASRRTISRIRSQNGYGISDETDEKNELPGKEQNGSAEKDPFEVGWDGGDNDPMCPRSFSKPRKWMITLIVSCCSFCV